ncbi:MAG: hypothetical protein PHY09_05550 [Desulfuromonadaceae bacterium]|nr:hypothetical protein [Desulfuromonadaceae bacterium]MDD5107282.1 hypothetical protein [Desulfuromonadaceae bacterium]
MQKTLDKVLIVLLVLLMMPSFASARTYWSITSVTSPASFSSYLTPVPNAGYSTTNSGLLTNVTDSQITAVEYDVTVPMGYILTNLRVDGAQQSLPATGGKVSVYRATNNSSLTHNIVATYALKTSTEYIITTLDVPEGHITPSVTYFSPSVALVTVSPFVGQKLTGIEVDGVKYTLPSVPDGVSLTANSNGVTYTFTTGNHTVKGLFASVPTARAIISTPNLTVAIGTTNIEIDGSSSTSNDPGARYVWTATSGTVTYTSDPKKINFTPNLSNTEETYIITLIVMADGAPNSEATVTIRTVNANIVRANLCSSCHNGTDGPAGGAAFESSGHFGVISCQNCHNPNNDLSHAYKPVAQITCSTTSCHISFDHNGKVASNACLNCHNKHSLQASGNASCDFCHGNPPGTTVLGATTFTHTSSNCSDCHSVPPTTGATATHRDGKIEILTNDIACAECHNYPPTSHVTYNAVAGTSPNCSTCHTFTDFNGVTHNNGIEEPVTSCSACHGNPPQVLTVARSGHTGQHLNSNDCAMCHGVDAGKNINHKNGAVNVLISGAPHFNNVTSGMYPAAYVTLQSTCATCHNDNANNQTIRQQWAATGHASTTALPWIDYDFKSRSECVRCHTTTGFIAYSTAKVTAAWGTASDKTKEVLTCVGCHSDVSNGTVRTVTPNKPFADEASFTNVDVGTSNICMDCHSGRNNGTSIQVKVGTADFTNLSYIAPHYLTAGGSLQGKSGYDFPGRTYSKFSDNAHSKVGILNSNSTGTGGPCVACHMSATDKHAFSPVTVATGSISTITATTCTNCHTDSSTFNAASVDARKVAFINALTVLKDVLASKNIFITDNYPYVTNTNWGTGQAGANVMGAAFNYKLFATEPGAYAHNPEYAKQLIADSIEAVVTPGNTVTGSDISLYLTADQKSALDLFSNSTSSCASCHSFPPATNSHSSAVTSPLNCVNCHIYTGMGGATHNNGTVDFGAMSCTSCHGNPPAALSVAISGHTGTHTTATDCATCHGANPGAIGHNNGTLATTCVACHGNPPTTVIASTGLAHSTNTDCATCHGANPGAAGHNNGTLATTCVACHGNPPNTQTIHTTGFQLYTHGTQNVVYTDCAVCHDSTHKNGTVDLKTNDNACSSCHSYPPASGAHATATGGISPNCSTCHGYTGYNVATHNNGLLNIDNVTCDTCHGYPPMPLVQFNARATGEYVNARVEDYAGGGGHHAAHLLPDVKASEGFTPCLPCHPIAYHGQGGGSAVRSNVNVNDSADLNFRFDESRPKQYNFTTMSCSNVSCHFQPTEAW